MTDTNGKSRARRTWGDSPTGIGTLEGLTPGTPEHFQRSLEWRSRIEQPWLPEVAPFASWKGLKVLEVGHGPGYDAYSIIRAGADYHGIDITPENVTRTMRALAAYGMKPKVQEGDAEALPFPADTFDVVYSNGVLHHCPDMPKTFAEAFRVLKRGGSFYVILYHRDSVVYRASWVVNWLVRGVWRGRSYGEHLRHIEYNTIGELPIVNVYSRAEVSRLLQEVGFSHGSLAVRKLLPRDMPGGRYTERLWSLIPKSFYETASRRWGWYVCAQAEKP